MGQHPHMSDCDWTFPALSVNVRLRTGMCAALRGVDLYEADMDGIVGDEYVDADDDNTLNGMCAVVISLALSLPSLSSLISMTMLIPKLRNL